MVWGPAVEASRIGATPSDVADVVLPDGTHARDIHGKEMRMALPDADSGVYLRGDGRFQVNIWCWPIGSGELYSIRTDPKTAPDLRAAATPRA